MRLLTLAATVLMTGVGSSPALAQNDFDVLLGELNFGDSQPSSVAMTLDAAPQNAAAELKPLEGSSDQAGQASEAENMREADRVVEAEADLGANAEESSRAAPEDLPIPPPTAGRSVLSPQSLPVEQGIEVANPTEVLPMAESTGAVGAIPTQPCDQQFICQPHQAPHLPPPSTLLEYMHSPDRYSNVWAGYAQQRQHRHHRAHKHLHGTCDCFTPKWYEIGGCGRLGCSGCTACEAYH